MIKGSKHTKETLEKFKKRPQHFHKGQTPWNKGKVGVYSEETRKKISNSLKGKKHSEETKMKRNKANTGRVNSEETKRKMSRIAKEKYKNGYINNRKGKEVSLETRKKLSKANKGKNYRLKGWQHTEESKRKMSLSKIGNKHTEKAKRKMRKSTIKRLDKQYNETGIRFPTIGINEKKLLDNKEKQLNITIERQYPIAGYAVDGYCKKTNTVYEVYEKSHYCKNKIEKDKIRQNRIQNELNCEFIIIKDDERTEKVVNLVGNHLKESSELRKYDNLCKNKNENN